MSPDSGVGRYGGLQRQNCLVTGNRREYLVEPEGNLQSDSNSVSCHLPANRCKSVTMLMFEIDAKIGQAALQVPIESKNRHNSQPKPLGKCLPAPQTESNMRQGETLKAIHQTMA